MTIKICHVTSAHQTNDVRIFKKECVSLAKKEDYEVFLVGQGESKEEAGVHVIGIGKKPSSRIKRMVSFSKNAVEKAIEIDADIYHFHDPELLRFASKLKKLGKKIIFDSHENILDSIDDKTYMPVFMRKCVKFYYRNLQNRIFPGIDGIIVVSPQMEAPLKRLNQNVVRIANYPILRKKRNACDYTNIEMGRIIFAGGVSEQWSHREIIQAIETLDGVEYHLYGPADTKYLEELKLLKGWKKVHYGGVVPFEVVQEEICKAQFVLALLKPGKNTFFKQGTLGNTKLFEAFENGKPVIATNFELWEPIVDGNNCGVCVNPYDVEAIRTSIQTLMRKSGEEYNLMSENGQRTIQDEFNWNNEEKTLYELYSSLEK